MNERGKKWTEMQIDILVQGVDNSDWLKINFDYAALWGEIEEWIERLEGEWKENKEFGY